MTTHFQRALEFGTQGEKVVIAWLQEQGYLISQTSFAKDPNDPQGARLNGAGEAIVIADILAAKGGYARWIEVKTKSKDVDYKKAAEWRQGIEKAYFNQYLLAAERTGIEGHLAFLVLNAEARKGCAMLRLAPLSLLYQHFIPHRGSRSAYQGKEMVFWRVDIFESHEVTQTSMEPQAPKAKWPWPQDGKKTKTHTQGYFSWEA